MKKRFANELIIGVIALIAIILFGVKGSAALALIAGSLLIPRHKIDERESQLFNKVGNYTAGASVVACVIIFHFSDVILNGQLISKNWLYFVMASLLIAHGASGLVIFRRSE